MGLSLGIDIGSTTLKIAAIDSFGQLKPIVIKYLISDKPLYKLLFSTYLEYTKLYGEADYIGLTGSGQKLGAYILGTNCTATEIIAHAKGSVFLAKKLSLPLPKTIVEIGGQDSKLILLENSVPVFFNMNSICSAGTGEFLRHTLEEQSLSFQDFNQYVLRVQAEEHLEDTCTVFVRRAFRHAGQNGVSLDRRLKGMARAILQNYLRTVAKNRPLEAPIFFLGGLSKCSALAQTLAELLEKTVFVPPYSQGVGAIGMAVLALEQKEKVGKLAPIEDYRMSSGYCLGCVNNCELALLSCKSKHYYLGGRCESAGKAGLTASLTLTKPQINKRHLNQKLSFSSPQGNNWAIGLDVGSRQFKASLICGEELIYLHTETTAADTYKQALNLLTIVKAHLPKECSFCLKTTGSGGRYLSRKLAGNESCYETEILCHYRAADKIFPDVGSVIDIGGNDSKIIIASNAGLDFAMNDRCAAGTGSFLEQLAKRFNLTLEEAALLALRSETPARIGSRCAVLAETDIIHKMRLGARYQDLLLGACYSLARTFISDNLHGRTLITPVVFQGGAFLNPALLLAFTDLLSLRKDEYHVAKDKRYLVGAGAIGAAIYALEEGRPFEQSHLAVNYSLVGGNL